MIGRFNTKITKLEAVRTPDGAGGFRVTWQPAGQLWAELI